MKRLLALIALIALNGCAPRIVLPAYPQNVEGQAIASQFGQFQLQGTATNSFVFTPSSCQVTAGNKNFSALTQGVPVRVVDPGNHALDETVTAGLVNINACSVQLSVANTHVPPFYVTSGTAGLQEAIDANAAAGPANTIIIDAGFYALGGTASIITSVAGGSSNLGLVDITTTPYTWYAWSGSAYAKVSSGSGTPGGSNGAIQTNSNGTFGGAVITGLVKGNGTSAPTAATAGTDYQAPVSNSCSGGITCPLVGSTYTFNYSGSAGSGSVGAGAQYQNSFYPNAGSTTGVGATPNEATLPSGLSSSQINAILSPQNNLAVRLSPGAAPVPFVNTQHNPIQDDNNLIPAEAWNARSSGAVCDAQEIQGSTTTTSGVTTLTAGASVFSAASADGATWVETVGTSSGEQVRFESTIATYVSATQVTLTAQPPFTISGAYFIFGHRDNAALADAIGVGLQTGRSVSMPNGTCWTSVPQRFGANIVGQGSLIAGANEGEQGTEILGSAGEDVFESSPAVGGAPAGFNTGNYTIALSSGIDATKAWEICSNGTCTQQTPLYRPIGILGPDAQDPLAPQWIEGTGAYNTGATNGVATMTNGSAVACVPTSETLPATGQQIVFPYQAVGTAMFETTVSSHAGSGCAAGTNPMTLAATWTPSTPSAPVEWFSGTSFQNIQTAIPATGRTFPMTITLANPILPIPPIAASASPAGLAPFGYVQIDAEQCAYYGNSNYPASASSVSNHTITLQGCAQNGTTAAAHSIGAIIVPLNPLEPSWPWPVAPTITSGVQTPANAEFFPAMGVGNAAISVPVPNGTNYDPNLALSSATLHDITINIGGGFPSTVQFGGQIQNDTAAMYMAVQPFTSNFKNIQIASTFYGIVEGAPSTNTNNYFTNGFPTADGNHWTDILVHSAAFPMDLISEGSGILSGLTFFSESYQPPNNYIPGFTVGADYGAQGNLFLDTPFDDQFSTYPYAGSAVEYTTFDFKYLEAETGFFNQTQPLDYWNCYFCTWIHTTPKSGGVRFVNGAFQQFYGGTLNINSTTPLVITGSNITFQNVSGMGSSYLGTTYGSAAVLNWGPTNTAVGPGDNSAGTVTGPNVPQLGGDSFAPVLGQTDETLATGNVTVPYVAKGLAYFPPEQMPPSTLDAAPMTGAWTFDATSPISNSYVTCAGGAGSSCTPAHMSGDYVTIGVGQRVAPTQYYGHASFKTPGGATSFTFRIFAQAAGSCSGGTPYTATVTTPDANWHDYAISLANFTGDSGCIFAPNFTNGSVAFNIQVGYIDLAPLANSIMLPVTTPIEGSACTMPGAFLGSDATYIYVCASGGTVKRVGIS